jgi:hypothetical protein
MTIKDFSKEEKAILEVPGCIIDEYTLQEIHKKTQIKIDEIEKIMETFVSKNIADKKENGFTFNYAVYKEKIRDLSEEWWDSLRYRICP